MRRAFILSIILHAALIGLAFVGLPQLGEKLPEEQAISVEIVDAAATDTRAGPPKPKPAETAPVPPRQAASPAPPPPPPPAPAPSERPKIEATPPPPAPPPPEPKLAAIPPPAPPPPEPPPAPPAQPTEPAPPPPPPPEARPRPPEPPVAAATPPSPPPEPEKPKLQELPEVQTPPPPATKPQRRPRPPKRSPQPPAQEATKEEDTLDAILRSVEKQDTRLRGPERRQGTGRAASTDQGVTPSRDPGLTQLSGLEQASIARQFESCWNIPPGVRGTDAGKVLVHVIMRQDGTVANAQIQDQARAAADPVFRALAESAQRAVLTCRLQLPPEKYPLWRDMVLTFDPEQAFSG